jgi:hypothetical protein
VTKLFKLALWAFMQATWFFSIIAHCRYRSLCATTKTDGGMLSIKAINILSIKAINKSTTFGGAGRRRLVARVQRKYIYNGLAERIERYKSVLISLQCSECLFQSVLVRKPELPS